MLLFAALVIVSLYFFRSRSTKPLTEKDTIVLADFANTTGDAVFDDALKQALAVDLEQSPFLNVLSDRKMGETLRLMGRPPNDRVTKRRRSESLGQRSFQPANQAGGVAGLGAEVQRSD